MNQKTIKGPFSLSGVALHSGQPASLLFHPSPPNSGVVFIVNGQKVPATIDQLKSTNRGVSLSAIATIEHLLSAAFGLGIDNLLVEVETGREVPLLDGSALPFVTAFLRAGLTDQPAPKRYISLARPVKVVDGEASLEALPHHGFRADFMIKFKGIGEQAYSFDAEKGSYIKDIAPARTFGYLEEVEALKQKGLAFGASYENALVLDKNGYVGAPRFPEEPVRHKILDLIGDLGLLGRPLQAEIKAIKSGHKLNAELVRRILQND